MPKDRGTGGMQAINIRLQRGAIQAGNGNEGFQPANCQHHHVNRMRDFSSGILKQFMKVLKMERNMNQ